MPPSLLLGIDVGTSGTKSIVVDSSGTILGTGLKEYGLNYPQPGWIEQDPEWWIEGVKLSARGALESAGRDWSDVAGIGMTHQRLTIVPVDHNYDPLYPAIMWNDTRISEEVKWVDETIGNMNIFRGTGCMPGVFSVYKVIWLKRNLPEIYAKTHRVHLVADWLIYKLTGREVTSQSTASMAGAIDVEKRNSWNTDMLEKMGLRHDIFVPDIRPAGENIGKVTKQGETLFGIPEGIPVVTSAGDQPCGCFGAGQFETRSISINGGTSCTCEALSATVPSRKHSNYFIETSPTGSYVLENTTLSGASALMKWYRNTFGQVEDLEAQKTGKNIWEIIYGLSQEAPVGNVGLFLVPYFHGSMAPYWSLDGRAALLGLSTDHGRPGLIRAVIEGLAYEARRTCEMMEEDMDEPIETVINYGGSARSRIWNQTFADVLNRPVRASFNPETTALGAAMCAAAGTGIYPDVASAGKAMVQRLSEITPIEDNAGFYDRFYREVYVEIYETLEAKLAKGRQLAIKFMEEKQQ